MHIRANALPGLKYLTPSANSDVTWLIDPLVQKRLCADWRSIYVLSYHLVSVHGISFHKKAAVLMRRQTLTQANSLLVSLLCTALFVEPTHAIVPSAIPGLLHWHDASSLGLSDGSPVGTAGNEWVNLAPGMAGSYQDGAMVTATMGGSLVAAGVGTPTYSNTGLNGKPAVHFDATAPTGQLARPNNANALLDRLQYSKTLPAGLQFDADYTMFVVASFANLGDGAFGANPVGWGNHNGSSAFFQVDKNVGLVHSHGGPNNATTFKPATLNTSDIYVLRKTPGPTGPANSFLSRNNTTNLITTGFDVAPFILEVGGGVMGVQLGWNGETAGPEWSVPNMMLAEVLIYDGALSISEINAVGIYLADKYMLTTGFVPEPGTFATLFLGGAISLPWFRRRRHVV
jgi:hypothetical protein